MIRWLPEKKDRRVPTTTDVFLQYHLGYILAFEGTPLPLQCGRPKWKPPHTQIEGAGATGVQIV